MKQLSYLFICFFLFTAIALPLPPEKFQTKEIILKTAAIDNSTYINANKIFMFVTNHGNFSRDLDGVFGDIFDYGSYYPYVSNDFISNGILDKSTLYAAGLWIGGKVNDSVRVSMSEYSSEYVPGPMESGTFMTDRPEFKVYKLYSDSLASNPNDDYLNWPTDQGAPVDGFGNPAMAGDQMLWTVFNDADPSQHDNFLTEPLGIEIQLSVWAIDDEGLDTLPNVSKYEVTQVGTNNLDVTVDIIDDNALTGDDYSVTYNFIDSTTQTWDLTNLNSGIKILEGQTNFDGSISHGITDGFQVRVYMIIEGKDWSYESSDPANISPVAAAEYPAYTGGRWFTGGNHGGELLEGGVFMEPNFWGETSVNFLDIPPIEIRFRPMISYTDLNSDGVYSFGEPYIVDDTNLTQYAFMYSGFSGSDYTGFYRIPYTVWDISDTLNPRQLNVVVRDRDENNAWDLHADGFDPLLPNSGDLRFNYVMIPVTDYDSTGTLYGDGTNGTIDWWTNYGAAWVMWLNPSDSSSFLAEESSLRLVPAALDTMPDTFLFNATQYPPLTSGPEGTSIYMKYKLYNKGGNQIDSCFVSLWTDPDLGSPGDDLVGCDTLNDIHFCYNGSNNDYTYAESPALGFKIIHGPVVPSPGDNAYFENTVLPDHQNLNMYSFHNFFGALDPENADEAFSAMKGLLSRTMEPYVYNGDTIRYATSGDPVTGTGDLDSAPSDRRMMASTGPFTFAPGDSQYVLIKMTVGQGTDRLASITRMKEILNIPYQVPTGINDDTPGELPLDFTISQNYPNPFNPNTQIEFSLPVRSDIKIEIFNILGQKVITLIDKQLPAGRHVIDWNGKDSNNDAVASGLYFYKMTTADFVQSKKMMLLK